MKKTNKILIGLLILIAIIAIAVYASGISENDDKQENSFRCQKALDEWIKIEKIKASSGSTFEVIETKNFSNISELKEYDSKWDVLNNYDIEQLSKDIDFSIIEFVLIKIDYSTRSPFMYIGLCNEQNELIFNKPLNPY